MQIQNTQSILEKNNLSTKFRLSKKISQRKQNTYRQKTFKLQDKLKILELERQNPITFLQCFQENPNINKKLIQSLSTSLKWKSHNSSVLTTRQSSKQKQVNFFDTVYTKNKKKQLQAIKIYNHIHNDQQICTKNFQQPEFLQFVQEAVSKSTRKINFMTKNTRLEDPTTKKIDNIKKVLDIKQNYKIGDNRRQIKNLQNWIKTKVEYYEVQESECESMIAQRINFLNMAFSEISRITGTFSIEAKHIMQYLHRKYYQYYNFLLECMIQQNKRLNNQFQFLENQLQKTIIHYETEIIRKKKENQERSQKIILNFQKCIELKKKLQKDNKQFKRNLSEENKKTKLAEQTLTKVIKLLTLAKKNIQQTIFQFFPSTQSNSIQKSLGEIHQIPFDKKINEQTQIFQQWCGYLIKMVREILCNHISHKKQQQIDKKKQFFSQHVFETVQQYLAQNDQTLSPTDAEAILNKFLSQGDQDYKFKQIQRIKRSQKSINQSQKQLQSQQINKIEVLNKKYQMTDNEISCLPTIEQVYKKIQFNNVDIQVNITKETQDSAVQVIFQKVMIINKNLKPFQFDITKILKQKIKLQSLVYDIKLIGQPIKQFIDIKNIDEDQQKHRFSFQKKIDQNSKQQKQTKIFQSFQKILKKTRNKPVSSKLKSNQNSFSARKSENYKNKQQQIYQTLKISKNNSKNKNGEPHQKIVKRKQNIQATLSGDSSNSSKIIYQNHPSINKMSFQQSINQIQPLTNLSKKKGDLQMNQSQSKPYLTTFIKNSKTTIYSQKYLFEEDSLSISSSVSILSRNQRSNGFASITKQRFKAIKEMLRKNKTDTILCNQADQIKQLKPIQSDNSSQLSLTIHHKNKLLFQKLQTNQKLKHKVLKEKILLRRSFVNFPKVQYAAKNEADLQRQKFLLINQPQKNFFKQNVRIDSHELHLEMVQKNNNKIKMLTYAALWHPKNMIEMRKIKRNFKTLKIFAEVDIKALNAFKTYFCQIIHPILHDFLKCYHLFRNKQSIGLGQALLGNNIKGPQTVSTRKVRFLYQQNNANKENIFAHKIPYYQRLSPLLYNIINFTQFHQNKKLLNNELFLSILKNLRTKSSKIEVYNILMEGICVQIDVFVKIVYQFNIKLNEDFEFNPEISFFILQTGLSQALEEYFTNSELFKIITSAKNSVNQVLDYRGKPLANKSQQKVELMKGNGLKKHQQHSKILLFDLLVIIYGYLRQKKQLQTRKYSIIKQAICHNSQFITYEDIMHFLSCLPVQNDKRKKILNRCLTRVIYWNSLQSSVSIDIFYFILDCCDLYNSTTNFNQNCDLINQYMTNRCELYFIRTLQKFTQNPESVINQAQALSCKPPKLLYRILNRIRMAKNQKKKKLLLSFLTLIYCNLVDLKMQQKFMPSLFNAIIAIPLPV